MKIVFTVLSFFLILLFFLVYYFSKSTENIGKKSFSSPQEDIQLDDQTMLFFEPEEGYKSVGDTFNVKVMIQTEQSQISGVELYISYDPTKLQVEKISPGKFFERPNVLLDNVSQNQIDDKEGLISYAVGTFNPKGGQGEIANIKFKVIGDSLASLEFLPKTKVASLNSSKSVLTSLGKAKFSLLQ